MINWRLSCLPPNSWSVKTKFHSQICCLRKSILFFFFQNKHKSWIKVFVDRLAVRNFFHRMSIFLKHSQFSHVDTSSVEIIFFIIDCVTFEIKVKNYVTANNSHHLFLWQSSGDLFSHFLIEFNESLLGVDAYALLTLSNDS